ncbi:DMT family transporter [Veronia pacifica]|uniref:EamA domain-containing protein n=1 Tax=Veronia pacifica TaxID=1080227 RepID=A0A1C3EDY4_9GAMM|nr:DMT family transporter [Veronia pacifica]ODA31461.1 hypothetical protein A8L45_16885 [Veronia pacifica]
MTYRDISILVLLAALWGASFIFTRYSVSDFGPFSLVFIRVSVAALVLLPFLFISRQFSALKAHWRHIFTVGVMSSAIPFVFLSYAMLSVTGGFASILNASTPIWGALIAMLWLNDSLSRSRIMGLLIGFLGVIILVWDKLEFKDSGFGWSVIAIIIATFMYGLSASYTKRYLVGVPSLAVATGSLFSASLSLIPMGLYFWPDTPVSMPSWTAAFLLGALCTGLAFLLFFRLLERTSPANATTVTYIIPIFATIWGAIFLGESVTPRMMIGATIIFSGTALAVGALESRLKKWRAQSM